jgi:hypothetical protein
MRSFIIRGRGRGGEFKDLKMIEFILEERGGGSN